MNNAYNNLIWVIYARKSTESEDRQIQSIDDQVRVMQDTAKRENLKVKLIISDAKSAKVKNNREGFTQMMKMINRGQINGILTWKTDRLSRNPVESGLIQEALQLGNIKCIKTSDRNHYPGDNALIFAVEQGMANQYSRDLSSNVKRGLEAAAKSGRFPNTPPLGYLNSNSTQNGGKMINPDIERFETVRKMWDLLIKNKYSIPKILSIATKDLGLRTPVRGKQGGKPVSRSYIYLVFSNIFYTGYFHYNGHLYKGNHRPMITMQEFDTAQELLGKKGKPRPQNHEFAYTGIFQCGECGASITATKKKKYIKSTQSIKYFTYYHCTKRKKYVSCLQKPITEQELENQFNEIIGGYQVHESLYRIAFRAIQVIRDFGTINNTEIVHIHEKNLYDAENKIKRLLSLVISGAISEAEYLEQKMALGMEIARLKENLNQAVSDPYAGLNLTEEALKVIQSARISIERGTSEIKRQVVSALGSNHKLMERKLIFDKPFWLIPLKMAEERIMEEIKRFELTKFIDSQWLYSNLQVFFPSLLGALEEVRTHFEKSTEQIPSTELSVERIEYDKAA